MARKIIHRIPVRGRDLEMRVYRDSEWDEYVVRIFSREGLLLDGGGYFTSDKEDALGTARTIARTESR